jgi:hypothetical protein
MAWRRARADELDHEALWLGVTVTAAAGAWTWITLGLPTPQCAFHAITGVPCPGCGATRCIVDLVHGEWRAALAINPLVFAAVAGLAVFDVYAGFVVATSGPRWRWIPSRAQARTLRWAAGFLLLLNWAWLIRAGV